MTNSLCGCDCTTSGCDVPAEVNPGIKELFSKPSPFDREPFSAKMDDWEQCAPAALQYLIEWMESERETLLALAKGRVALGHYRHGDTLMYEFSQQELEANAAEELGDAINYVARLIHLRDNAEQPRPFDELIAS